MKIRGREWHWWLANNDHRCSFCREREIHTSLAMIVRDENPGMNTTSKNYWHKLYYVWLRHMKEYHPELLKQNANYPQ